MNLFDLGLRNKFIMSPVKTGYGDAEGNISERHLAFWEKRSKHVAAVIFEPFFIDKRVRELPTQIGIDTDDKIEGHKKLVEVVHKNGAKAVAHINHPGRMANPKLPGNIYLSASDVQCPSHPKKPDALTIEEIADVQRQYINAAVRAERAGYDIIEIQFGLGYLIAQFISPETNKREDNYGSSFENRLRFGLEILRKTKENVNLPVIVRISGDEKTHNGLNLNDAIEIVKKLEKEGVAAIHVTSGNVCTSAPWYYQHHFIPKGANWEMSKKIKAHTSLPIIAVGQITEPEDIDNVLSRKAADFIALGRALIADPDFVGKYLHKVNGAIRPCSSCLTGCLGRIKIGKGLQCEINPEVGKELEPLVPAEEKKNYAVVGGGMAGMEAALTLKQRGHSVTLYEKNQLGGQFNLAPLPSQKGSLQKQIDYLKGELKDLTVIKKEALAEDLIGRYDGVVLASGSSPVIPPIEGLEKYSWAEILYKLNIPKNKKVLIVGGGLIGVEIANTLVDYGNEVVIVEMLDEIARGMEMISKKLNLMKLQKHNVKIFTNTKLVKVDNKKAYLEKTENSDITEMDGFDLFVIAAGMRPNNNLYNQIKDKIPAYLVGDSKEVGDVVSAVQSAYFTCREI